MDRNGGSLLGALLVAEETESRVEIRGGGALEFEPGSGSGLLAVTDS